MTPCLFGLYSLVALLGQRLHPTGDIPFQHTAWYRKHQATFIDVLAAVRPCTGYVRHVTHDEIADAVG